MEEKVAPTKLWTNYALHNAKKWLGLWTRWDPTTRDVIECFEGIRHIELFENMSKMKHQNTFIYKDGSVKNEGPMNGPWEYRRDRDCDEEGLCHPSTRLQQKKARAFFFENGGGAWTVMEPKLGDVFFQEIFFPNADIRFSTGLFYDKDGKVSRITEIREDSRGRPSLYWSSETKIKESFCLPLQGKYTGTKMVLTAGLKQTVKKNCEWKRESWLKKPSLKEEANAVFYLPDNIAISCPLQLYEKSTSQHFYTSCFWFCDVDKDKPEIREQTVHYDNGKFTYLEQGIYYKTSEPDCTNEM